MEHVTCQVRLFDVICLLKIATQTGLIVLRRLIAVKGHYIMSFGKHTALNLRELPMKKQVQFFIRDSWINREPGLINVPQDRPVARCSLRNKLLHTVLSGPLVFLKIFFEIGA
ncbi:hypothetical protein PA15_0311915 [Pseudomonas aeruginosa HB15]|nr:hypothetical protein PA15_0311915 [Pseudomonas aeruginosa HB15]KXD77651.1 hypothetical protein AW914_05375 [Pseudomonas aeruginosa]KXD95757.1 hypothetical protein AW915_05480 [Pseudomonas aeruginosa]KXE05576.1 hypothetical protein AW916_05280 [Pseudomonas aeruginosa]OXZ09536.1 hypothetical protein ACG90_26895 [Pseudomonas aeruginosa]